MNILKVKRLELALSQGELADRAGVSINTISDLEKDPLVKRPYPATVRKLAKALGIEPIVLFGLFNQKVRA